MLYLHSPYILSLITIISAYNLDIRNPIVIKDPRPGPSSRNTYFGYSVALFSSGDNDSAVLVGAPRANSSAAFKVIEPGSVYVCHFDGKCTEWQVDMKWNERFADGWIQTEKRDYAWLGANIKVENSTRPKVAVCAPRWKMVIAHWYMNGMCFSSTINRSADFKKVRAKKHFPLVNKPNKNQAQTVNIGGEVFYLNGMGESGFSLDLTEDRNLLVGAPGVFHWTGSAMLLDQRSERDPRDALTPKVIDDRHFEYNDYFGYSVISGNFFADDKRLYAASAPRSSDTLGKVFVFAFPSRSEEKLIVKTTIVGEHIGEYFGFSLTSCDINNDGRDDLIVGAPFWSKESDEGRVYIYTFQNKQNFSTDHIGGKVESGRFGTSISCLGDIDYDGYADLAVGAPYDDAGAVYIFNGGSSGLDKAHSQVIRASDFEYPLKGFGISISDPRDINNDRYPDVAVGAYSSGHAVVLKAKPVVTVDVKIYRTENFTLTEDSRNFFVNVCSIYNGAFAPDTLNVTLELEIDKLFRRVMIYENRLYVGTYKKLFTLNKAERMCKSIRVNLKKNQNVVDPIEIVLINLTTNSSCSTCPIINRRLSSISDSSLKVAYALGCGDDEICTSDLNVRITSNLDGGNRYIVGSNPHVNMTIFMENKMEPAYRAFAHIYISKPIGLHWTPPECDEKSNHNNNWEIVCDIGNPLRYNNSVTLGLDMTDIIFTDNSTQIQVEVTTQSEIKDSSNIKQVFKIDYDVDVDVKVLGKSYEQTYFYFDQKKDGSSFRKITFNHIYEVWKYGVSPVEEIVLLLDIPRYWKGVEIATIDEIYSFTSGKKFECETIDNEEINTEEIYANKKNRSLFDDSVQTLVVNCTGLRPQVCQRFQCKLGPFTKTQSVAKVNVTVNLNLSNFTSNEIKGKNVLFFVSNGLALVTKPNVTIATMKNSYNFRQIATMVLDFSETQEVSIWIIILSVLLGIFMLMMLALFLYKIGFFKRRLKEDMDALKPKDNTDHDNVNVS